MSFPVTREEEPGTQELLLCRERNHDSLERTKSAVGASSCLLGIKGILRAFLPFLRSLKFHYKSTFAAQTFSILNSPSLSHSLSFTSPLLPKLSLYLQRFLLVCRRGSLFIEHKNSHFASSWHFGSHWQSLTLKIPVSTGLVLAPPSRANHAVHVFHERHVKMPGTG